MKYVPSGQASLFRLLLDWFWNHDWMTRLPPLALQPIALTPQEAAGVQKLLDDPTAPAHAGRDLEDYGRRTMKYQISAQDIKRDGNNFAYHPCKAVDQAQRYQSNRDYCLGLATRLRADCPPSRELSLALTKLEEVMFWANAAIARNEEGE